MHTIVGSLPSSIPNTDNWDPGTLCHFDNLGNFLGVHLTHRSTKNGEILAKAEHSSPIYTPMPSDDPISKLRV
jgi:hypothetical protein